MILHIVKHSPNALTDAANIYTQRLGEMDGILLIQDAVYGMLNANFVNSLPALRSYCLKSDMMMRGIDVQTSNVEIIDDAKWVELCLVYEKTLSW